MHPVGSYCVDISRCTVNKTLKKEGFMFLNVRVEFGSLKHINLLKPNDIYIYIYIYICRTAALTSRSYILNIYSTNIHTEYFKHAA